MDVSSTVITTTYAVADGSPPYLFTAEYPASAIEKRNQYNFRATISLDQELLFTSTQQLNPLWDTQTPIEISLSTLSIKKTTQQAAEGTHLNKYYESTYTFLFIAA